jgi:hypothetical protein
LDRGSDRCLCDGVSLRRGQLYELSICGGRGDRLSGVSGVAVDERSGVDVR